MVANRLTERLVSFASIIDHQTMGQAYNTALMDFIFPHLALMPDAHLGKGATVGSVIPTLGCIMPAAVGVDIGCGMIAVKTQFTRTDVAWNEREVSDLREMIEDAIPLGKGQYNDRYSTDRRSTHNRVSLLEATEGVSAAEELAPNWRLQLGTLGGGNHFIECSYDEDDNVWLFLHSGSRGVGNKIAQRHIKIAREQCKDVHLPDRDLAYLSEGTDEFWNYIRDLRWAQAFALKNREEMMHRLAIAFGRWIESPVQFLEQVNCHHNYTEEAHYYGKRVWLSRKGAINARLGVKGLIPGSMGDLSYVVTGKDNPLALSSAPHGAGRVFSRSAAKRELTFASLQDKMSGIEWRQSESFLDEHPDAYKPIDVVMEDARDLVSVEHTLRQFLNVKGD